MKEAVGGWRLAVGRSARALTSGEASSADRLPPRLHAPLSTFDAAMIAVGVVVGAGIFKTPATVAEMTGSPALMMAAWVLGGALSLFGALTYAELASTYPSAGGDYTFLMRAYGRNVSFFFAWARSMVIVTGSIALLGFILGDYLSRLLPLGAYSSAIYAALAVVLLTVFNLFGLRGSSRLQNVLTLIEVSGVILVAVAGWMVAGETTTLATSTASGGSTGMLALAMVFVLLTYGGWNEAAYVSAEVAGGAKAITRALITAIAVITVLYVAFVWSVWAGLGFAGLASSDAIGVDVMTRAFGDAGAHLIGVIVALCALTSMNGTMLVGARSNYAVGCDWKLFAFLSRWRDEDNVPIAGFLVQAGIALLLIAFGAIESNGFHVMVEFTAPVFWFFFMLSGAALFVLRHKHPQRTRGFRVPGYPVIPAIFVLTCAYLFYSSLVYAQSQHAVYVALGVMATGAVVWLAARRWGTV